MTFASSKSRTADINPFMRAKIGSVSPKTGLGGVSSGLPSANTTRVTTLNAVNGSLLASIPPRPLTRPFPEKKKNSRQQQCLAWMLLLMLCAALVMGPTRLADRLDKKLITQAGNLLSALNLYKPGTVQPVAIVPLQNTYVSSKFGRRWGRQHQGVDYAARLGEPIHPMSVGTVEFSGWQPGYGRTVIIDHGQDLKTRYAHCSKLLAKAGQQVSQATTIATVGSTGHSTGPHLHFEVIIKGVHKDPLAYIASKKPAAKPAAPFNLAKVLPLLSLNPKK